MIIERMEGLSELKHYIVGHINNCVNGPHSAFLNPLPHPKGSWHHRYTGYHAQNIAGTGFCVFDRKRYQVAYLFI